MIDVSGLFGVVQIVTDLFPIALVIGLIIFFFGLIFDFLGSRSKLSEMLRMDKYMVYRMIKFGGPIALILGLAVAPVVGSPSQASLAITIDSKVLFPASVATIKVTGVTVSAEYTIWATGNSASVSNVSFVATLSTEYLPVPVPNESDRAYTLNIARTTAGNCGIGYATPANCTAGADGIPATYFVSLTDPAGFLPTDLFLILLVPVILILIIVGIAFNLRKGIQDRF